MSYDPFNNKILEREREREREREKRCDSFLKKSFSLVEAAIYLMLVGVLTMAVIGGAALVEKARVRSVIEDIEFYVKAYRDFTTAFNAIPGSITLKQCQDNIDIFKLCSKRVKDDSNQIYLGDTVTRITPGYLSVGRNQEERSEPFNIVMRQWNMFTPLLGVKKKLNESLDGMYAIGKKIGKDKNTYGCSGTTFRQRCLSYSAYAQVTAKIHYDMKNSAVALEGFYGRYKGVYYARCSNAYVSTFGVESSYSNMNVPGLFNMPNTDIPWVGLVISYNTGSKFDSTEGAGKGAVGLFGAKFLEKVDKKMDTGFPRVGKLLALKISNGVNNSNSKDVCYQASTTELEKGKKVPTAYVQNNKKNYGCNVLYVMPDVSEFVFG